MQPSPFNWRENPSEVDFPRVTEESRKTATQRARRERLKKSLTHNYNNSFNVALPTLSDAGKTARIRGRG